MNKLPILLLLIVLTGQLNAQTKNQHWIGLNAEYSTLPGIVNKRVGANLTYIYGYKRFCSKLEAGFIPGTNFGIVRRLSLMAGLTTDLNQAISAYVVAGLSVWQGDKNYENEKGFVYALDFTSGCSDLGLRVRPLKNERLTLGLDGKISSYDITPQGRMTMGQYVGYSYQKLMASFSFSVNYKLNKPGKESIKN